MVAILFVIVELVAFTALVTILPIAAATGGWFYSIKDAFNLSGIFVGIFRIFSLQALLEFLMIYMLQHFFKRTDYFSLLASVFISIILWLVIYYLVTNNLAALKNTAHYILFALPYICLSTGVAWWICFRVIVNRASSLNG